MGYKLKRIMMRPNGVEKQVRPPLKPITTPGIYHNATLGLISLSSDGNTRITIADKNLGATTVYNSGNALSEANCGKYYQRGNNYGFPRTGSITTSATRVNAGNYGPNNYYNSGTYIYNSSGNQDRDTSQNTNLWGGTTNTAIAMKGPCGEGWHVGSQTEWDNILSAISGLVGKTGANMITYLFMPYAGIRSPSSSTGAVGNQGVNGRYWVSTGTATRGYCVAYNSSTAPYTGTNYKCGGFSIRPYKNEAVQPNDSWTVLYTEELKDLAWFQSIYTTDYQAGLDELNTKPVKYYNKFVSEGAYDGTFIIGTSYTYTNGTRYVV